ncbi:MAG: TonB-dependent receptor [Myxococcota bacterium]|jgi:iron complex outermembrane receptor protein|nr:TonB-dependent receptor [Myxococcota bacterium]
MSASYQRGWVRARACVPGLIVIPFIVTSVLVASTASADHDPEDEPSEVILVKGQRPGPPGTFVAAPDRATPNEPDATKLLKLIPGGDTVSNGPLTGQVQYRGMFGDRISVKVDDTYISPGGPNWMDAPLHYAPRPLLDHLEMDLGIASVSAGAESIGGSAHAVLKSSEFAEGEEFVPSGEVEVGGRVADKSFIGGGILSAGNENHRAHFLGSAEIGKDFRIGDGGRVKPTEYERYQYGGGYGFRYEEHEVGFDYRYNDTKDSGTPALPMDIRVVDTHLGKIDYGGQLGPVRVDTIFSLTDVDHVMDNFSLRDAPADNADWRKNSAETRNYDWSLAGKMDVLGGMLEVGVDGHHANHDALVTNPNNAMFFVEMFDSAKKDRYGVWVEWTGEVVDHWDLEVGVRTTRIEMDSDKVDGTPADMMLPAGRLRDAFNEADRSRNEDLVDAVVKLGFAPQSNLRMELSGGRKTRAPSYVERYGWLPTQAASGLADGNNYVGDIGLDPEVSYEVAAEVRWDGKQGIHLTPRAFYKRVYDYIQGTPSEENDVIMVSTNNDDDTPLQFSNVDARFYGFDLAYGAGLPWDLQLDGTLSYVRGKRVDINDDLYRISPLRGRTTLTYDQDEWSVSIEGMYAAKQKKVSDTNGEDPSDSWGILNIYGSWEPMEWLGLTAGVNNVTDNDYHDHLAGISRVSSSGVDAGDAIPAPGVSFFARAVGTF